MTENDRDTLIRQYAAGEITWALLRQRAGLENYRDVLAGLGELGLRPPIAPMEGPNVEARTRARAVDTSSIAGSAMTRRLGLIVTDALPLITLAAGDALECLTMPGLRVIIPDMVYFEVTQDLARTGAGDIVGWARRHHEQVEIAPTEVFGEFQVLRAADAKARSKGRGEQSAARNPQCRNRERPRS